jgi:hypothetical protein
MLQALRSWLPALGPAPNARLRPGRAGASWGFVTLLQDRHLQTGLAGSLLIHALLLLLFVGALQTEAARRLLEQSLPKPAQPPEPEVALLFPTQLEVVPPKPKAYIRTTQNEASATKPSNAAFQSDRDTVAASARPAVPGSTLPMPTLDGTAPDTRELADRDHRDGEIKNDSAPVSPIAQTQMLPPPAPSPPPAVASTPPEVVKAIPLPDPMTRLLEQADRESPRLAMDSPPEAAPQMRPPEPAGPQVRAPAAEAPPPVVKAIPVPDPVAKATPRPERDAFSPFTRTSKTDGSILNPGANAVDAEATPLGRYMRQVTGAVERKWHLYVRLAKDSVNFGRVRFRFYVDARGTPQDLTILSDARDADPRMRELTLRAILDAQIPPIPPDLMPTLDDGRVKIEYEAIVY